MTKDARARPAHHRDRTRTQKWRVVGASPAHDECPARDRSCAGGDWSLHADVGERAGNVVGVAVDEIVAGALGHAAAYGLDAIARVLRYGRLGKPHISPAGDVNALIQIVVGYAIDNRDEGLPAPTRTDSCAASVIDDGDSVQDAERVAGAVGNDIDPVEIVVRDNHVLYQEIRRPVDNDSDAGVSYKLIIMRKILHNAVLDRQRSGRVEHDPVGRLAAPVQNSGVRLVMVNSM